MSEVLILEFPGATVDHYLAVNKLLDVQVDGDDGDWPSALTNHVAATSDGSLVVVEVWDSKEAQAEFMERLQPALASAGVPDPSRAEWLTLAGQHVS